MGLSKVFTLSIIFGLLSLTFLTAQETRFDADLVVQSPLPGNALTTTTGLSGSGVVLNRGGSLSIQHIDLGPDNISEAGASTVPAASSWDMINLRKYTWEPTGPPFNGVAQNVNLTWALGVMRNVQVGEYFGGDYDCQYCLTFTAQGTSIGGPQIKRMFDENGQSFQVSDQLLKKNIADLDNALKTIGQLSPKKYQYKTQKNTDVPNEFGLLAQDVQKVLPQLVKKVRQPESGEETLLMNYTGLIPILIKSIQEQQEVISKLENRIQKLERK